MRKFVVGFLGLVVLACPALAADLPVKVEPLYAGRDVVPPFTWTGCYLGGFGGGFSSRKDWTLQPPNAITPLGSHAVDSWVAGGDAGCDYQFNNWLVVGIAGDYGWADGRGRHNDVVNGTLDQTRIKSLASVTGRVGWAWDHWLAYGKGGVAWTREEYSKFILGTAINVSAASETRQGWTAGAGVEYALNKWMSIFVEYDYYDFGTHTVPFFAAAGVLDQNIAIKQRLQLAKGGINFRWGGW